MSCKLIWITPEAEKVIAYCARVSNPANQDNENIAGLLNYCMKHGHWSVFEMASMCVEITTSRAIAPQILRHRSFSFQEFSQRYAEATDFEKVSPRRQDVKNRQNSIDDLEKSTVDWFEQEVKYIQSRCMMSYEHALSRGIAKECARMFLPLNTTTKLYMTGTLRSWATYFQVRMEKGTQLEHRVIATSIWGIFQEQLPIISQVLLELNKDIFYE